MIITALTLSYSAAHAYDEVIKNKYGKVTGYTKSDKQKTQIYDKSGGKAIHVDSNGFVKDRYGRTQGKIKKK